MSDQPKKTTPMTLGEFLRDAHESQAAFARRVEVHYSVISKLVAGKVMPGLVLAVKIERATKGKVPPRVWVSDHDNENGAPLSAAS